MNKPINYANFSIQEILELGEKARKYDEIMDYILNNADIYVDKNNIVYERLFLRIKYLHKLLSTIEPERYDRAVRSKKDRYLSKHKEAVFYKNVVRSKNGEEYE